MIFILNKLMDMNNILSNNVDMLIGEQIELDVEIEKVRFYNEENNYHIMMVSSDNQIVGSRGTWDGRYYFTIVGCCATCSEGDRCNVLIELKKDKKYGIQYEIKNLKFNIPSDKESLKNYLSAVIEGARAEILYNAYPDIVERVIDNPKWEPDYSVLKGIREKTWGKIRDKIVNNFGYNELITLLSPVGVSLVTIKKIADKEKNLTLVKERIIKNPYILCQYPRMGFKKVDTYAIKLNPNLLYSEDRVIQCITYILNKTANDDGNSYIEISKLKELFRKEITDSQILPIFDNVINSQRNKCIEGIKCEFYVDDTSIGLMSIRALEGDIMRIMDEIQKHDIVWDYDYQILFDRMEESAKEQGFYLSQEQTEAVRSIAYNNISIMSGKAGCVDCDTEYFNGTEWKRIADYKQGDKVLQYNPDNKQATLVQPLEYIKIECDKLYHFYSTDIDQCLSSEHRILYYKSIDNQIEIKEMTVSEYLKKPQSFFIPSSFYYNDINVDVLKKDLSIQTYFNLNNINIKEYKTVDGYKYCFSVPTGALILRRNNKIFVTGNSGKTSVIKTILSVYNDKRIAMCALSAKAAKRMSEVTGMEASTIHKLLSVQFNGEEKSGFLYNANNPLPYDLIIVDECSMNNVYLLNSLLKAVSPQSKIVFCGDIAQLPSIGVGSVFTDLVQHPIFNNHSFTKVYRQSEESFINTHANLIREGILPFDITSGNMKFGEDTLYLFRKESEDVRDTAVALYLEFLNKGYDISDVGIICPRKNNCCVSCDSLNNIIQNRLLGHEHQQVVLNKINKKEKIDENDEDANEENIQKVFKLGARIINKKNDYRKGILNGDMGTVVDINEKGTSFNVLFDNGNFVNFMRAEMITLELGYAISVHSSQGSQYKACIVAMDMSSYTLLSSNLIYTAITRAIDIMIVCSQPTAFVRAVTNTAENHRNTYLKNFLNDKNEEEYKVNFEEHTMFHNPIIEKDNNIKISSKVIMNNENADNDLPWEEDFDMFSNDF